LEEGCAALRLDKFLYFARFAKSRSRAQSLLKVGSTRIDGAPIQRTHVHIHEGSVVTIIIAGYVRVFRIEALPVRRGPACEAQTTYCDLSPPQSIDAP
jgi:ribosome-associated heat shock protein Hsp15